MDDGYGCCDWAGGAHFGYQVGLVSQTVDALVMLRLAAIFLGLGLVAFACALVLCIVACRRWHRPYLCR